MTAGAKTIEHKPQSQRVITFSDSATLHNGPVDFVNEHGEASGVKHDVESVVHLRYLRTFLRPFVIFFALLDFFFFCSSPVMTGR